MGYVLHYFAKAVFYLLEVKAKNLRPSMVDCASCIMIFKKIITFKYNLTDT